MANKKLVYPKEWKAIAHQVKEKATWVCEGCHRPCRKPSETWDQFKYRLAMTSKALYLECCDKPTRFVLTVSHQDHDTQNSVPTNLKALCSVCHLRYDAVHHAETAAKTRELKAAAAKKIAAKAATTAKTAATKTTPTKPAATKAATKKTTETKAAPKKEKDTKPKLTPKKSKASGVNPSQRQQRKK